MEEVLGPLRGLFGLKAKAGAPAGAGAGAGAPAAGVVPFWTSPDRAGWLQKQGAHLRTWRKRWFVLKDGQLFWFLTDSVTAASVPRGCVDATKCMSVKGAEDVLNKAFAFEVSTPDETVFFVASSDKDKEDWINAIGRAIVKHSRSLCDEY